MVVMLTPQERFEGFSEREVARVEFWWQRQLWW